MYLKIISTSLAAMAFVPAAMAQGSDSVKVHTPHIKELIHVMPMNPETVEWQCDVYRELVNDKDVNTPLFHAGGNRNLFSRIFSLFISGKVKGYTFELNDYEDFDCDSEVDIKDILENFNIFYTVKDNAFVVEDINVPYDDVISFYIKEAVYYDLTNSSFRNKVVAICPVLRREDDFGDYKGKFPMFWVLLDDILPQIKDLSVVPNSYNKVNRVMISDYFARNLYSGDIFKVYNTRGLAFAQYCETDSLIQQEREKAENKLRDIKLRTYNTYYREKTEVTYTDGTDMRNRKRKENKKHR